MALPLELPVTTECSKWLNIQSNETCQSAASLCNTTVDLLINSNSFLESGYKCEKLLVGSKLCCDALSEPSRNFVETMSIGVAISNFCGHSKLQSLCAVGGGRKSVDSLDLE